MRTNGEINTELGNLCEKHSDPDGETFQAAAIAAQALAWVLGDELSALEMIEDEFSEM